MAAAGMAAVSTVVDFMEVDSTASMAVASIMEVFITAASVAAAFTMVDSIMASTGIAFIGTFIMVRAITIAGITIAGSSGPITVHTVSATGTGGTAGEFRSGVFSALLEIERCDV
jgi:hypothetical protein